MAETPKVYVICDANCKWESMTKEQILTAIMQAVNEGTIGNIDTGFITTVKTINGEPLKFFYGKQAAYNALSDEEKTNLFAVITDDTTKEGIEKTIKEFQTEIKELKEGLTNGTFEVDNANYANQAERAENDENGNKITETYGNFARGWESSSIFGNRVELSGTGTYLVYVNVNDTWCSFNSSTMVYFNGKEIVNTLYVHTQADATVFYRLKVYADGGTHVERSSKSNSAFIDYTVLETSITSGHSVTLNTRKIL